MDANVVVEFGSGHGQIFEVLDHLESWERHSSLEIIISESLLAISKLGVGPSEHW